MNRLAAGTRFAAGARRPMSPDAGLFACCSRAAVTARDWRSTMSAGAPALIRSDPELTQLEADVARLRAQAASVARDPEGLRQRSERALAQRDAQCRDKACLLRWYAQRKRELFAEF